MPDIDALTIVTRAGTVRGAREGNTLAWRGIPYAASTAGPHRFRAPRAVEPWTGVRAAVEFGPSPAQDRNPESAGGVGTGEIGEDCLSVNVVRPAADLPTPRPVMVWIYGGAYRYGASRAYPGRRLAEAGDVVVVTFNYRTGPFGFSDFSSYSTPERRFDSNVGLRDQVAALEWVRDNIGAFGGDPANVTVFGESAGAGSIVTLMAAPAAQGLFHKAIAESTPAALAYGPERHAHWAHQLVGFLGADRATAGARLVEASAEELLRASAQVAALQSVEMPGTLSQSPVIDGEFLPHAPLAAFRAGLESRIPLIVGTNDREGRLFQFLTNRGASKVEVLPTSAGSIERMFASTDPSARDAVVAEYRGYPRPRAVAQLAGDLLFWHPTVEVADSHSGHAPTWSYRFDYASPLLRLARLGATHGTEVPYVFGGPRDTRGVARILGGGRTADAISDEIMRDWTSFAWSGRPDSDWPGYETPGRRTKIFRKASRVVDDPRAERRRVWSGYRNWNLD